MDFEEQYDKIYRYACYKMKQAEIAEDITQETFLRFLESDTYRNTGQALQYLYTIARNLCMDEFRKKQCLPLTEEYPEEEREDKLLDSIALRSALDRLQEEDRELILLRYVNEVPMAVIGRIMNLSRFAAYRRVQNALKQLKMLLGKEGFD